MKKRAVYLALVAFLAGCESVATQDVLDTVELGPDECGSAEIRGNLEVGGTFGFFTTTVVVNIDKEKRTYIDGAGAVQACTP